MVVPVGTPGVRGLRDKEAISGGISLEEEESVPCPVGVC